jgi:hypothetical protein
MSEAMTMTTDPVAAPTFFDKVKAAVLKLETEALAEVHAGEVAALAAEHALITDAETLFARIKAKM